MTSYLSVELQSSGETAAECESSPPKLVFPRINDISLKKQTNIKPPNMQKKPQTQKTERERKKNN